jgi:LEA14-like dessication related protein
MHFRKSILFLIAFFASALLLVSCGPPKALEYRDFKNFSIEKLGFSSSTVKMDLVYFNPNNYGLQLKRTDLDIYINDVFVGHTTQEYQVTIPKKEEFSIPIQLAVDMRNLFKNSLNVMMKDKVMVKLTGSIKVGKANVFISFPVNYQEMETFSFLNLIPIFNR